MSSTVDAADEYDELVSAKTPDAVLVTDSRSQPRRDRAQQFVAGGMTERVVDALEPVEVDEQCGRHGPVPTRACEQLLGAVHHECPVGQPRECIVQSLVAQLVGFRVDEPQRALPTS